MNQLNFPDSPRDFFVTDAFLNTLKAAFPDRTFDAVPLLPDHPGVSSSVVTSGGSGGTSVFDRHRQREQAMSDADKLNVRLLASHMTKR
jgi:hypothetical protein